MEIYVIRHIDGRYVYQSSTGKQDYTLDLNQASHFTYEKAHRYLTNCIGPEKRKNWEIIKDESTPGLAENATIREIGYFNWEEISHAQFTLFNELTQYARQLRDRLSDVDLEINDIQHYIEFFHLDAAKGYKAYRMLKERLEHRRQIKNEMAKTALFLAGNPADFSSGHIDRQIKSLDHCTYRPRILCELFGVDTPGTKVPHIPQAAGDSVREPNHKI